MTGRTPVPGSRGALRRQEILDAAIELFAQHGYRGTGLIALGRQVGMSHVGVLSYFGTKEGLLRAVMERRDELIREELSKYRDISFLELLRMGPFAEPDTLARLAVVLRAENLNPGDPLHEYFQEHDRRVRTLLTRMIRSGQKQGQIRSDIDADTKAIEIIAFTHGIDTQWLLDPDQVDRQKVHQSFERALIDDLTSSVGRPSNASKSSSQSPKGLKKTNLPMPRRSTKSHRPK